MSTTLDRSSPAAPARETEGRIILADVSWDQYEALLDLFTGRRLRITYDRGTLEIMSPSSLHEWYKEVLASLVRSLAGGLKVDYVAFGSTRFKNKLLAYGVEPDACFLVDSYRPGFKWREYDVAIDPPPDLVIEVDLTSDSKVRLKTYASLKVREVWRFDGADLTVLVLRDGAYVQADRSPSFPLAPLDRLTSFVRDFEDGSERVWMDEVRAWASSLVKGDR